MARRSSLVYFLKSPLPDRFGLEEVDLFFLLDSLFERLLDDERELFLILLSSFFLLHQNYLQSVLTCL